MIKNTTSQADHPQKRPKDHLYLLDTRSGPNVRLVPAGAGGFGVSR
ncbi:hypothetical protein [Nonomuraea jabiensis]